MLSFAHFLACAVGVSFGVLVPVLLVAGAFVGVSSVVASVVAPWLFLGGLLLCAPSYLNNTIN